MENNSYADISERLFHEFGPVHGLTAISDVLRRCRADLQGSPNEVMLSRVEEQVRQRLAAPPIRP
jgi:hypothetical protein